MSKIGVILPVYNCENYITNSVESILNQTYKDFDLYVIEDGSTDGTLNALNKINDSRLKVISNEGNKGLIYTLNRGLELTRDCKYIARMDADDISLPTRFQVQHDFLEANKNIGLLGSAVQQFGEKKQDYKKIYRPETPEKIASTFMFYNPMTHPTIMIRTEVLNRTFSFDFPKYEDYHLWIMMFKDTSYYNLKDVLVKYRRHADNVTGTYKNNPSIDYEYNKKLLTLFSGEMKLSLSDEEVSVLSIVSNKIRYGINPDLKADYLNGIKHSIIGKLDSYFDVNYFNYLFNERMILYFLSYKKYGEAFKIIANLDFRYKKIFAGKFFNSYSGY